MIAELFLFCGVRVIVFTSLIFIVLFVCLYSPFFPCVSFSLPTAVFNKLELS